MSVGTVSGHQPTSDLAPTHRSHIVEPGRPRTRRQPPGHLGLRTADRPAPRLTPNAPVTAPSDCPVHARSTASATSIGGFNPPASRAAASLRDNPAVSATHATRHTPRRTGLTQQTSDQHAKPRPPVRPLGITFLIIHTKHPRFTPTEQFGRRSGTRTRAGTTPEGDTRTGFGHRR